MTLLETRSGTEMSPDDIQKLESGEIPKDNFTPMLEALSKAYLYFAHARSSGGIVNNIEGLQMLRKGRKIGTQTEGLYKACQPSEQVRSESIFGLRIPLDISMDIETFNYNVDVEFYGSQPYWDQESGGLAVDIPISPEIYGWMEQKLNDPEIIEKFGLKPSQYTPATLERYKPYVMGAKNLYKFRFLYDAKRSLLMSMEMRLKDNGRQSKPG